MKHILYCAALLIALSPLPTIAETNEPLAVVNGVSWELASYRKENLSNINYDIDLEITEQPNVPIKAVSEISFDLKRKSQDLQIDFKEKASNLSRLWVNGKKRKIKFQNEHIIINKRNLIVGENTIKIEYFAGNGALNRTPSFLYSLFVPDRMRTSFPSFDQPNLKATFDLKLTMPEIWQTISSAPIKSETVKRKKKRVRFETSDLMSTYLFSFVAGRFIKVTKNIDGTVLTMLHREPDAAKAKRNEEEIFRLHKASIDYMEEYTGIKQPFKKFGFALIPSFQFGGMEHVGAIQYQASTLMLDENPSPNELLGRAALIGHETAHMWFGDLVTMDWFNDVWTKEVFANFMSAKLVNPSFPEIDHQLRSHLRLHLSAYNVDRSEGPNPIRQELPNLNEAGTMYGGIIYNKAPIMMQQLEILLGEENFREGIREYLRAFAFSNATWADLIKILDKRSDEDLKAWSDVWVNTPGRPTFTVNDQAELDQTDPYKLDRKWPQKFAFKKGAAPFEISFINDAIDLDQFGNSASENLLLNSDGLGYGLFPIEKDYIQENWPNLSALERAAAFVSLYEQLLEGNGTISPHEYLTLIMWTIEREENPLIINHLLRQMISIYWSLLNQEQRLKISPQLEQVLWQQVNNPNVDTGEKRAFFRSYANIALTEAGIGKTKAVWNKSLEIHDLRLATRDYTNMAAILAIKLPDEAEAIIEAQKPRVNGLDNQRRFEYIQYALSSDQNIRDSFFNALLNVENRQTESWVLSALNYLHHPLRAAQSEKYIQQSLEVLQEIQITGDIFFPGRWLAATLKYYQSDDAVKIVRDFLNERPHYNKQLRMKILQEADDLFRANKILKKTTNNVLQ